MLSEGSAPFISSGENSGVSTAPLTENYMARLVEALGAAARASASESALDFSGAPILKSWAEWNRFGIRDPSLLVAPNGTPSPDESGGFVLFVNGRDKPHAEGGTTRVGRVDWAVGADPVPGRLPAFEFGAYCAQGSVLRMGDRFRLYFSYDTAAGFGIADSDDGLHWTCIRTAILTPAQFGASRIGLPYVIEVNGQWIMTFEGTQRGAFRVFMALSPDGLKWSPFGSGKPILAPGKDSWDSAAQANPSIYVDADSGRAVLAYNGFRTRHGWDIGLATAGSPFTGTWTTYARPLAKRGGPAAWNSGRLEGARPLLLSGRDLGILCFGLPGTDSYGGGSVALLTCQPFT